MTNDPRGHRQRPQLHHHHRRHHHHHPTRIKSFLLRNRGRPLRTVLILAVVASAVVLYLRALLGRDVGSGLHALINAGIIVDGRNSSASSSSSSSSSYAYAPLWGGRGRTTTTTTDTANNIVVVPLRPRSLADVAIANAEIFLLRKGGRSDHREGAWGAAAARIRRRRRDDDDDGRREGGDVVVVFDRGFRRFVDALNAEREANGERRIDPDTLRHLAHGRDFDGNDYDRLYSYVEENGPAVGSFLSAMGATDAEIGRCPTRTLSDDDVDLLRAGATCPVCLEGYGIGAVVRTIP
ncbi:hypothetical protein ACHAW5_003370 [Stephanodiscus triporus]|uniref:Uncharacterized protein n=1 Tax=Stephanodiscus triporus TaxID=2934178 RepID=A0ABD3QTB1_9STRA